MLVEIQSYQEGVCFGALRLRKRKRMVGLLKVCLSPGRSQEEMGYLLKSPERWFSDSVILLFHKMSYIGRVEFHSDRAMNSIWVWQSQYM